MTTQVAKTQVEQPQNTEKQKDKTDKTLIVDIHNLKKYYGPIKAVDGIDLQIEKGTIFGFLGPNGAGKTTTIGCLITLLSPTDGSGTVAGYDLYDKANIRKKIAAVFQEQTLDETLTGYQNLALHAELYRIPKKVKEERIKILAKMVGLEKRLNDAVIKYSGGMRRRLEIARGLLTNPEILFLDEPTIGLDPQSRAHIWEKIKEMNKDGMTIFITTHSMEEAEELCDKIAIIDKGKIVVEGTAEELKSSLGQDIIRVELKNPNLLEKARERAEKLEFVENTKITDKILHISTKNGSRVLAKVIQAISGHNDSDYIEVSNVEVKKPTLNDVFLYYTGKEFRDEDEVSLADRLKMVGRKSIRRGMMGRR